MTLSRKVNCFGRILSVFFSRPGNREPSVPDAGDPDPEDLPFPAGKQLRFAVVGGMAAPALEEDLRSRPHLGAKELFLMLPRQGDGGPGPLMPQGLGDAALHDRRPRPLPLGVREDVDVTETALLQKSQGLPEFLLRFARTFPLSASVLFPGFFTSDCYHPFSQSGEAAVSAAIDQSFRERVTPRPYNSLAAWIGNLFEYIPEPEG